MTIDDLSDCCGTKILDVQVKDNQIQIQSESFKEYNPHSSKTFIELCRVVFNNKTHGNYSLMLSTQWKDYMEYALIHYFEKCINLLDNFDVIGVNLNEVSGENPRHFSGNFWWMRYDHLVNHLFDLGVQSHSVEFWAANHPDSRLLCICNSNLNHYHSQFPEEVYKPLVDESFKKLN